MKRIYLLMILFVAFAGNAIAQRMINIELTMQTPTAGYTIDSGVSFNTFVIVKNVGTVPTKTTDSILYIYTLGGNGIDFNGDQQADIYYRTGMVLNQNDTFHIKRSFSIGYTTQSNNDQTIDYCVVGAITNRSADSARDNVTANNSGCNSIKMKANYHPGVNVQTITGSDDVSKVNQVYPNPAANSSTIDLSLTHSHNVVIRVMDLQGRTVISNDRGKMEAGNYLLRLDTYTLQNGIYLYQVNIDGNVQTGKLTIAK